MLVGTWAAAEWAIRFYRRHGFQLVAPERTAALLKAYWTIPDRQIATSVVLADPPFAEDYVQAIRSTVAIGAGHERPRSTGSGVRHERRPDARQASAASGRLM
jgi:hypothetical protein